MQIIIGVILVLFFQNTMASKANDKLKEQKHQHTLPLDLNSYEYQKLYKQFQLSQRLQNSKTSKFSAEAENINSIISWGERNLKWIDKINESRPESEQIKLSDENSRRGYPMEAPSIYSEQLINQEFAVWMPSVTDETIKAVWSGQQPITSDLPIEAQDFQKLARKMDYFYQTSVRWKMLSPSIPFLKMRRVNDVRGYYFLNKLVNREEKLRFYNELSEDEKKSIKDWLFGMCYNNSEDDVRCLKAISLEISKKSDLNILYEKYLPESKKIWNNFFGMYFVRSDIKFEVKDNKEVFTIPFLDPNNNKILNFVKLNTEDEWRGSFWNLIVNFVRSGATANIRFQPGVTPNVSGGNTITMDANENIESASVKWIIRHEFGHVLGLPDCYHEFYDDSLKAIVNYQLDVTDLMCSRAGNIKPRHYEVLKKAYAKP